MAGVLIRRGRFGDREDSQGIEGPVRTEADTGVLQPQAQTRQGWLASTRTSPKAFKDPFTHTLILDSGLPEV